MTEPLPVDFQMETKLGITRKDKYMEWQDAVDCRPEFVFDVEMKDGQVSEARFIMGNFETFDGRVLYPERFRFKEYRVVVPVGKWNK